MYSKMLFTFTKSSMKVIDYIFLYNYNIQFNNDRFDEKLKMCIIYLATKLYLLRFGQNLFYIYSESEFENSSELELFLEKDNKKSEKINKDNYLEYISEAGLNTFNEIIEKVFFGLTQKQIEDLFNNCIDCKMFIKQNYRYNPLDCFMNTSKEEINNCVFTNYLKLDIDDEVIDYSYESVKNDMDIKELIFSKN